jgi:Anti-sigma factor NepR
VLTPWPKAPQTKSGALLQRQEVPEQPQSEPALPTVVTACLGERLRAHYAQLMKEPVPDDLLRILEALDRTGRAGDDW